MLFFVCYQRGSNFIRNQIMLSSKEIDRRTFLKGGVCFPLFGRKCFLGRDSSEILTDVYFTTVEGGILAGLTAWSVLRNNPQKARREFLKIAGAALGGAAFGLTLGESFNWWTRRKEVEEFLSKWPSPPEGNKEIAELSLLELVALINRLEDKMPTTEEADILLTATAYQAAQFLRESPFRAKEYARRMLKIFDEKEFREFCQNKNTFACTGEFSGGKLLAGFDFNEEEWERLFASEIPVLLLVKGIAHEVAHMNVRRLEIFLQACGKPEEDYGVLGRFEVIKRRGFFRQVIEPKSESRIENGLLEEEFFAEWAAYRFLNELGKAGLEKKPFESPLLLSLEFLQAIINLEYTRPGANWPAWWQGVMDFDRVAKLHRENDLWHFRRDLGEVVLNHIPEFTQSTPEFSDANKAALGKLAFEAFSKTDEDKIHRLLNVLSEEELLNL